MFDLLVCLCGVGAIAAVLLGMEAVFILLPDRMVDKLFALIGWD